MPPGWDAWLARQGTAAGYCQTSAWARINEATNAVQPVWFEVARNEGRRAGILLGIGTQHSQPGLRPLIARLARGTRFLVCHEGPVLVPGAEKEAPALLEDLLTQIEGFARQNDVREIRFAGPPPLASWLEQPAATDVFGQFGYRMTEWRTRLVDLTANETLLHGHVKHSVRKGIRKCVDAGVRVRRCESRDEYLQRFCAAYYEKTPAGERNAVARRSEAFWAADRDRHYRFFVAEDRDGTTLATLGTYAFNGVATEIMSLRTRAGQACNLPAQDLLHWEAFLAHKAAGDRWFDLAGYSPDPQTEKEAGIRRFKEKWGGVERLVPRFARSREPAAVRLARRLLARPPAE